MSNYKNRTINPKKIKLETKMVRGGTLRSNFGETSEAIFLNSGFCYNSAEIAESRFNGEEPGFVYSRYLNPTFGAGLQTYIFEQLNSNTEVALEQDIQSIISEFFPSVIIGDLEITSQPDTLQIIVKLTYSIKDTGITDNLEIAFN